ncbi:outer membrane protein transport protein [Alloalcanivorax xenomutans]|uniref:Outer membrane protein transport protein n=1 Tax=Alloalcanivorax xenomutans TaxID=1094342 RepID=A0A9Q3ZH89_9GAMM|nr:outer membrane protein transport protein [Alloalcanivorax xenomutans]ARB46115.1 aromatic hydrocarbon degradation protein [Alloalcanivorax xenomutans]MCE7508457.1 outer membrane protein transport protein [Alloalcanivorax xenomutans]
MISRSRLKPLFGPRRLGAAALLLAPAIASANMGNIATSYGVLPSDVATVQALSMFNTQVSTTYYNPAFLARDTRGEMTAGLMHADPNLKADSQQHGKYKVQDDPTQQILLGLRTDLSGITELGQSVVLGLLLGSEKYSQELMAFTSQTAPYGQYFNQGREPLFLSLGIGTNIWRGLAIGFATRVTLHSDAKLVANTDLSGNTQYETLDVTAKPVLRPILSMSLDWKETFCPDADCWYNGVETAFAFRGYSYARVSVDANTIIPGTIPEPGLFINLSTIDSYQPNTYVFGTQVKKGKWRTGVALEFQEWSKLEDKLTAGHDDIKDVGDLQFRDTFIPRIGVEYEFEPGIGFSGGIAYQESPLETGVNKEINYLDARRTIFGLGFHATAQRVYGFAHPVRFDLAYQYHAIGERDFRLISDQTGNNDRVKTDGDVNVFAASISMQF